MSKKLLILGGKPIGSVELVKEAQKRGYHTIVTDYLEPVQSPAKQLADEHWEISTAEVDRIAELCKKEGISSVVTGVHEFNINRMLDICELTHMNTYCTRSTWLYCDDKLEFKSLCQRYGIDVAKKYDIDINSANAQNKISFPVITKPEDGSGSRGFAISNNYAELKANYKHAQKFSPTGRVIIEDYIPFDAVIIQYTMIEGKCIYSGMSDKKSCTFPSTGAKVMGIQTFPSKGENSYLANIDEKARHMFESEGFLNGPIWIEAFYDGKDKFIFNEMGYRFGGSLTYYPVKYFTGIDQLNLMLDNAMGNKPSYVENKAHTNPDNKYCILPIHIKAGKITKLEGMDKILAFENFHAFVPVHFMGDTIEDWGSAQQVYAYLHMTYDKTEDLKQMIKKILNCLKAIDANGNNMLYTLIDIDNL